MIPIHEQEIKINGLMKTDMEDNAKRLTEDMINLLKLLSGNIELIMKRLNKLEADILEIKLNHRLQNRS